VAHARGPYGIIAGGGVVVDNNDLTFWSWAWIFAVSAFSSSIAGVVSLDTAAGVGRTVVLRHGVDGLGIQLRKADEQWMERSGW